MSKKARTGASVRTKTSARRDAVFQTGLQEAERLLDRKRPQEALALLQPMEQSHPGDEELLVLLVNSYHALNDLVSYQRYAERLLPLRPGDSDLLLSLVGVYMANMHPALAVQTLHRFLELYPDHPKAKEARQSMVELETTLDTLLPALGLTGADKLELAVLHDRMNVALNTGEFAQGRKAGQQLLRRQPAFMPAHNNLSIMDFVEGKSQQAIGRARLVLTLEPEDYQALGNLTRFLALTGQQEEAQRCLQRLLAIDADDLELLWKQAETLAYLGEDQALLEVYRRAEAYGYHKPPFANPLLHHLAAVAALRLGHEKQARDLWRQALKLNSNFALARANLADLQQPVEKRHAPWPFPLSQWVAQQILEDTRKQWQRARESRRDDTQRQATLRVLNQHPELATLAGMLLDRGDPDGREFALEFALLARTPEMLQALHDFAFGQRGPDEMRMRAAQELSQAGLLPGGPVRTWVGGQWKDITYLQFEIDWEPRKLSSPEVTELVSLATYALRGGRSEEAERLLLQALELAPNTPEILNNLAMIYEHGGRNDEAMTLLHRVQTEYPNYFFGIIAQVNLAISQGAYGEATDQLQKLTGRRSYHISEFETLCMAYIDLGLGQKNWDLAEGWLNSWQLIDPDSDALKQWRVKVKLQRFFNRR